MKKLLLLLCLSSTLIGINAFAETLYINGKPVDQKIVNQTIEEYKKASPMVASQLNNPQFKKQILQSIGMRQAILLEGDKNHLDKSSAYQKKLEEVKPIIYAQILQEQATQSISDSELKAKYEQLKQQASQQVQYNPSHILVKDQKTAMEILNKLKQGSDFATLAKKYSIDPGSKDKGGDLGWSDGSNYVGQFTTALKTLKKGEYTHSPVATQFGFHIIKLNDMKTGAAASNLPAFDKYKDQLKQQVQMEKTKAFFENLKSKYQIEVK